MTVKVDDDSRGNYSDYYWNFDGFGNASTQNADFTFPEPGFCVEAFPNPSKFQ
jgi:PKD repeat protein